MKKMIFKMKTVLKMSVTIMLIMVIFIDDSILNSVIVQYDTVSNNLLVEEVASTIVERSSNQLTGQLVSNAKVEVKTKEEKVVEKKEKSKTKKVSTTSNKTSKSSVVQVSTKKTTKWIWPTKSNYIITSYYGYRWGRMHEAIDISGTGYGSSIYAANNGVVTTVKGGCIAGNTSCNGKGGNYIVIKHNTNNYYTVYMHLKDIYVSKGQKVSAGQVIGTMGNTGNVSPVPTKSKPYAGTHLHFAVYVGEPYNGGYAVNPMNLY